ncbi:ATP-binding protein [Streptomyces parvus]|uniref:ATP-binding protein n=1 Tax=Streptomyces parvus TaxID=66428 RepID=UPI002100FA4B|nr:ATP-binding protein [Streptomyces parvus]MCQ1581204.1 ATP-binding protein [Streptomyces parvus]
MQVPFRHIAGHLVWSTSGNVWALWRLEPVGGRYISPQARSELLSRVTSLVRSLAGAPRLFGFAARVDPGELAEWMVEGVDWERRPPWAETVAASLDMLAGQEMHRRTLWLAVPLASRQGRFDMSETLSSLTGEFSRALGIAPPPVPQKKVAEYRERAERVQSSLGTAFGLRPATPAEIVWMVQHAVHRGLEEPLLVEAERSEQFGGQVRAGVLRSPSYADLGQVRLAEGGREPAADDEAESKPKQRSESGPWWRGGGASPLLRRWLQVECEAGTGYQAHLVLAEVPKAQPMDSADLLAQLEVLDFPVDFTVDMEVVPAKRAREQVQRKKKELLDQAEQYGAQPTGMPHSLPSAAADLGEEDARLSLTGVEVEVQSVTVLTVWADDAVTCDARARALASMVAGGNYRLVRPHGLQQALFSMGLPGTARPVQVREFTQHQLSEDWAASGAFTSMRVGDPNGALVGIDLDCGTVRPVLINIGDAPRRDMSASIALIGELGGGKTTLLKQLTAAEVDRGSRAIVIDRTPLREWARFGRSAVGPRCQVIDAARAEVSIDPLRTFHGREATQYAHAYLTLQLGVGPMTAAGAVLHTAVKTVAAGAEPSMAKVLPALRELAEGPDSSVRRDAAATMADLLEIISSNTLAAMVFDPALPVATLTDDLGADMVVITTAGLTLPPREAFADVEVLRQQPPEALIGRAVLYLVAAMARQAAFTDPDRFCMVVMDEIYWLTSSAEGSALVHEILHDGRKHYAGAALGAHDEKELGASAGLISYRAVTRTTDKAQAKRALAYLGLDSESEDLVRLVTMDLSPAGQAGRAGEMLLRDPRMQVGRVRVYVPPVKRIQEAIFTTPGASKAPKGDVDVQA